MKKLRKFAGGGLTMRWIPFLGCILFFLIHLAMCHAGCTQTALLSISWLAFFVYYYCKVRPDLVCENVVIPIPKSINRFAITPQPKNTNVPPPVSKDSV